MKKIPLILIQLKHLLRLNNYQMEWIKLENFIKLFVNVEMQLNLSNYLFHDLSGFCENCVKKMKEDYEKALNEYLPIST